GFALSQPALVAMLIFTSLGMGMAAPYVVLASSPALMRFVPKPGLWMESLKQFMGFLLMATVIWLAWVLGNQAGVNAVVLLLFVLLFVSVGGWILGRWGSPVKEKHTRLTAQVGAVLLILVPLYLFIA
ncbi:MAG: thiol:disulfide interchange protein, partial [Calditrichaeota bacterium]|nr:thiol:disulfide interchange protein [Calditrichota bacterium]